ncbi:MAG: hypothetical protein H8E37_08395 [Planctomycetes bacterium]|nr:hypothetical protein [Planctomycetota bacterium]
MSTWQQLIQQLHASPHRLALAVTGGGSLAVSNLLTEPGASATILEATVPYSTPALTEWIGREPESFCSRETALAMATSAWWRARQFSDEPHAPCLGVSCTAALASARPKRGEHRCWVAVESDTQSTVHTLTLSKGARDRGGEEDIVRGVILRAIGEATGLGPGPMLELVADETVIVETEVPPAEIAAVRNGETHCVWSLPDGSVTADAPGVAGLMPGSFHPLHDGHTHLRQVAERILGGPVAFEMSIVNADKPPIDFFSLEQRRQAIPSAPVAITATPRFVDKVGRFPGMTFVIGFDTAARIIDPKFYGGTDGQLADALTSIRKAGCRFLVAGRQEGAGRIETQSFRHLSDLNLPAGFEDLFSAIPEAEFREDISSTELRNRAAADAASS